MSEPGSERKRRRRRRAGAPQGPVPAPPPPAREPAEPVPAPPDPELARAPKKRRKPAKDKGPGATDRGMRDLVGSGHSALGVDGALRGREVSRPTEADLAEAEREVSIVRRNWRPPPQTGRSSEPEKR